MCGYAKEGLWQSPSNNDISRPLFASREPQGTADGPYAVWSPHTPQTANPIPTPLCQPCQSCQPSPRSSIPLLPCSQAPGPGTSPHGPLLYTFFLPFAKQMWLNTTSQIGNSLCLTKHKRCVLFRVISISVVSTFNPDRLESAETYCTKRSLARGLIG